MKEDYQAGKRVDPALLPTKVSPLCERALRHSPGNPLFRIERRSLNSQSNFVAIFRPLQIAPSAASLSAMERPIGPAADGKIISSP